MGRRVVVANFVIGLRIPKKLDEVSSIIGFFNIHSKIFSRYDNLEVD